MILTSINQQQVGPNITSQKKKTSGLQQQSVLISWLVNLGFKVVLYIEVLTIETDQLVFKPQKNRSTNKLKQ